MVKNQINFYKKGVITKYYKSKAFQDSKKQVPSFPQPGDSLGDATLDLEIIPFDQGVIVHEEFMQKKLQRKLE